MKVGTIAKQGQTSIGSVRGRARPRNGERGVILIHVAIALLGLLAFSSFSIDYGVMMVSRGQAQTAAGALAAALYLAWDDGDDLAGAQAMAVTAAQANLVWGEPPDVTPADVTFPTCPPGAPGLVDNCVRVDVFRNQRANGNPLPVFVASLFGMANQGVRATATAQVLYGSAPGPGDCVKPFAIPDRWEEFREAQDMTDPIVDDNLDPFNYPDDEPSPDESGPSTWDPDDGYNARFTNGPNRGELLNSLPGTFGDPIDEYWPGQSGYHMPQNVQAETDMNPNGIRLALKHSNGNQVAPSWYYPIVLECGGANCDRAAIEGCVSAEWMEDGVALTNEPCNMVGPTRLGANNLIAQDSGANWMRDPPGGRYPRGTIEGGMGMASPRLAIVPVFDADIYMAGHQNGRIQAGNAELMVTRFVGIFFQEMQPGGTLMGHIMPLDFTPTPDQPIRRPKFVSAVRDSPQVGASAPDAGGAGADVTSPPPRRRRISVTSPQRRGTHAPRAGALT